LNIEVILMVMVILYVTVIHHQVALPMAIENLFPLMMA
jgi:hypothetical protein